MKKIFAISFILLFFAACTRLPDNLETRVQLLLNPITEGVVVVFEAEIPDPSRADIEAAVDLINHRFAAMGYPMLFSTVNRDNQIRVEIPYASADEIRHIAERISHASVITFRDEDGYVLLTGEHVATALRTVTEEGIGVSVNFTEIGTELFAEITRDNIGRQIAIYSGDILLSAPFVNMAITDGAAFISGGDMTINSAGELARLIQLGTLPFEVIIVDLFEI